MHDFSHIVTTLSCGCVSRFIDVYATTLQILANTNKNLVVLQLNYTEKEEVKDRLFVLQALAKHNNNQLYVNHFSPTLSLAFMYSDTIKNYFSRKYWLSIDDDILIPASSLSLIREATMQDHSLLLYGFFECVNYRKYKDWNPNILSLREALTLLNTEREKEIIHRLQEQLPYLVLLPLTKGQHSGSFIIKIEEITRTMVDTLAKWEKGRRGVDVFLCKSMKTANLIFGANAFHTDRTQGTITGFWKKDVQEKL